MEIQIRIKMERPRWARLPRARWAQVGLALVFALVVAVPFAWASDRFADVPASSPHHNDINAIATAGITRGCNPPANTLYCPGDPVRRDQMASFLQRGLGRAGRAESYGAVVNTSLAAVNSVAITVPGSGLVLVTATGTAFATSGCATLCRAQIRVSDPVSGQFSQEQTASFVFFEPASTGVTWLFPVTGITSPTTRTFNVDAQYLVGTGNVLFNSTVTALWVPFGPTGANTLGAEAQQDSTAGRGGGNRNK